MSRVSKTQGVTKTINFFEVKRGFYLVDLPGYGYAKVSKKKRKEMDLALYSYLNNSLNLTGVIIFIDIRRLMRSFDFQVLKFFLKKKIKLVILLSKSDKISKEEQRRRLIIIKKQVFLINKKIEVALFSSFKKVGLNFLLSQLDEMFEFN